MGVLRGFVRFVRAQRQWPLLVPGAGKDEGTIIALEP